jgi:hypothetical protein
MSNSVIADKSLSDSSQLSGYVICGSSRQRSKY